MREIKEIIICDNCKSEHNELKNPVRAKRFDFYGFDLCEKCNDGISKIFEAMNKELAETKNKYKSMLKKNYIEIYNIMFQEK